MSGTDALILKDGIYPYFTVVEAFAGSPSGADRTGIHLNRAGCTDCVVRAETLPPQPGEGILSPRWHNGTFPEYLELERDVNRDGSIDYEPHVIIDCETPWWWKTPYKPHSSANMRRYGFATGSGTWSIDGITFACNSGVFVGASSDVEVNRSVVWHDTHSRENYGGVQVRATNGLDFHHSVILGHRGRPWVYDPATGDSGRSMIRVYNSSTEDVTFRNLWIMGAHHGPSLGEGRNLKLVDSFVLHSQTHAYQGAGFEDAYYANLIRDTPPWGLCREPDYVCYEAGGAGLPGGGGRRGASCNPNLTAGDVNGDGIGDAQCGRSNWDVCRQDPEKISDQWCYTDADCGSGVSEATVAPSSAAHYGEVSIPTRLQTAQPDATFCDVDIFTCIAQNSNNYGARSGGCGMLIDSWWRNNNSGPNDSNPGDGDVIDFGVRTNSSTPCATNETLGSCTIQGTYRPHARHHRGWEPRKNGDGFTQVNISSSGRGHNLASLSNQGTSMQSGVTCSVPEGSGVDNDCEVENARFINNASMDLSRWMQPVWHRFPQYSDGSYPVTATNWVIDNNAYGLTHSQPYNWTTIPETEGPLIYDWFAYWSGIRGGSPGGSWHTSFFNAAGQAAGNGLCANPTCKNAFCDPTGAGWGACGHVSTCIVDACSTDTDCAPNTSSGFTFCMTNPCLNGESSASGCSPSTRGYWQEFSNWGTNSFWQSNLPDELQDYHHFNWMPKAGSTLIGAGRAPTDCWANSAGTGNTCPPSADIFGTPRTSNTLGAVEYVADAPGSDPVFPVGSYDKWDGWNDPGSLGSFDTAYFTEMMDAMVAAGLNTVKFPCVGGATASAWCIPYMDLAQSKGLRVLLQIVDPDSQLPSNPSWNTAYTHPSILAFIIGDEPKTQADFDQYAAWYDAWATAYPGTIILTAMVGENIKADGSSEEPEGQTGGGALAFWQTIDTDAPTADYRKYARYYPYRVNFDLINWCEVPIPGRCQQNMEDFANTMATVHPGEWWYVNQTFGGSPSDTWRYNDPDELEAHTHIALAYGTRAIFSYSWQEESARTAGFQALVENPNPSVPQPGGLLQAWTDFAGLITTHADLLSRHTADSFAVTSDDPDVLIIARQDPVAGDKLAYVVNLDATAGATAGITIDLTTTSITDVYTGAQLSGSGTPAAFSVSLAAGQGAFYRVTLETPTELADDSLTSGDIDGGDIQ